MPEYSFGAQGILSGIQALSGMEQLKERQASFPALLAGEQLDVAQKKNTLDLSSIELTRQRTQMSLLSQAISQGKFTGGSSLSDEMNTLAEIALRSDQPSEANQYSRTAADLSRQQAYLENVKMNQAKTISTFLTSSLDSSNVHDQSSWLQFRQKASLQASLLGDQSLLQAVQSLPPGYDPRVVEGLRNTWQTSLQTAQQRAAEARTKASEAQVRHDEFLNRQSQKASDLDQARIDALHKTGAGNLVPKASDVKVITDLMSQAYGDPSDLVQTQRFNTRARPVAERMLELMRQQGLSQSEASRRAFQEAKQNGAFGGLRVTKPRLGAEASTPAPLPKSKEDVRNNTWYDINGVPMLVMDGKAYTQEELKNLQKSDDELESEDEDESEDDSDAN